MPAGPARKLPMNVRTDVRMDKAQFFDWLEHQKRKYELADGRVVMMPWVTRPHARICTNVVVALTGRLERERFDVVQGDFAVETGDRSVRFADVLVDPQPGERPIDGQCPSPRRSALPLDHACRLPREARRVQRLTGARHLSDLSPGRCARLGMDAAGWGVAGRTRGARRIGSRCP